MADFDIRIPDPDDSYTYRLAPGYISIIDHNKAKVDKSKKAASKPKKKPAAPSRGEFTPKSRLALQKSLNEVKKSRRHTHYIVLTFPNVPDKAQDWKRGAVSNLRRRFVNKFPQCWFFWRLMPEKQRGVPVFHLLGRLEDDVDTDTLRELVTDWWAKLLGFDPAMVTNSVDVQLVTGTHEKLFKSFSREEPPTHHTSYYESWSKLGKRWDFWNRKRIPFGVVEDFNVRLQAHEEVLRVLIYRVYRDIDEIKARLSGQIGAAEFDRLQKSIAGKQRFLDKLQFRGDNIIFPDKECMELARETLREFR